MSGISYNYMQMHTNGSNLNRQVFFVDDRTKFHVARCCVTQKNAILILNILMTMTMTMITMIKQPFYGFDSIIFRSE